MPRIVLILAALAGLPAAAAEPHTFTGKAVSVQDGDTLHVLDDAKHEHTIRLDGIDAPETRQPFGTKARDRLAEITKGKPVTVQAGKRDKYGRTVARIEVEGQDVNRQMVAKIDRLLTTKSSQCEEKVVTPDWITNPNQQAHFRKLPADERARLEALPDDQRRGSVRQAAIAAGIVKVPSVPLIVTHDGKGLHAEPPPIAHVHDAVDAALHGKPLGILRRVKTAGQVKPLAGGRTPSREQEKRRRGCHAAK
jgi:hypothetical protein